MLYAYGICGVSVNIEKTFWHTREREIEIEIERERER